MNEQEASTAEEAAKFTKSLYLDTPDVRGRFSDDGTYSYFYDGPLLRVFSSSGPSVCQFDFSKLPALRLATDGTIDTAPSILCVAPFNKVNVVVGLEDAHGQGLLYLVNVVLGKVLRAFAIPCGVTSVETIHGDSVCHGLPYLCQDLQSFSGLVACGTKQGQIYLIDMTLDQQVLTSPPLQLHSLDIYSDGKVPNRKQLISSQHKALSYSLANRENPEYFSYMSAGGQVLFYADHDDVYISSLKFLPQLGSLCVGYNFGSFQLWRLNPLILDYSSPVNTKSLPVSHFAYVEPENDPKSFCYLWVAKCSGLASAASLSDSLQEYVAGSVANVSLHQLHYEYKSYTDDGSPLFRDLMQVGCALQHQLAPDKDLITSWVVSCDTLSNIKSLRSLEDDSQLDVLPTDMCLTMVSWRVRYTDNTVTSHFALFDINRWYHAQMPKQIRCFNGWCSYFSQYTFDDAVGDKPCVDLYIDTSSISSYKCPRLRKLERFQYPSSLKFEIKVMVPDGIVSAQYNGVQRQSLVDVVSSAVECVAEPHVAFELLHSSGLIPNISADLVIQRGAILTTLLLHTHTECIVRCFDEFSASDDSPVSVDFLMTWLWERLERVIQQFDSSSVSLYDWSGTGIDFTTRHSLLSAISQTKNIIIVLQHACNLQQRMPQLRLDSPDERLSVAQARLLHMRLVWWCLNRGLLPETGERSPADNSFSYPASTLKRSYNNGHLELLAPSSGSNSELMIDIIAMNLGSGLITAMEQEGGKGNYPPPNIKALLDIFLLEGALSHKLMYFIYIMLDLMALVDNQLNDSLSSHTHSLLASIEPGKDNSELSSLVLALWSLDHREYENVIVSLRQPGVGHYLTSDLSERMLTRLLAQGQAKTALSIVSLINTCSRHSVNNELIISIYLANGMTSAAVDISRNSEFGLDNFTRILTDIKTSRDISDLLCLSLTQQELDCVEKHLGDKGDLDKLVIHHLQMGNLSEAVQLNRALNSQPLWKGDLKAKERAMTRDRLVKWQLSLLPPIQKKLLEDPHYLQLPTRTKTTRPRAVRRGFFFGARETKALAPVEIAQMVMESNTSLRHKPFIHNLTSSIKKPPRSNAFSSLKKKSPRSITGLFDSPTLSTRSFSKRRMEDSHDVPAKRSASDDSLISWNDMKSLLRTPLVKRMSPTSYPQESAPAVTPHSILKMRKPQFKTSSGSLSGQRKVSSRLDLSADKVMCTLSKSAARVKFDMPQEEEVYVPPQIIDFNEEDDASISELNEKPTETSDTSEIEFNMSAPLAPVITAGHTMVEVENDDSFNSALSEVSPLSTPTKPVVDILDFSLASSPDNTMEQESPPRPEQESPPRPERESPRRPERESPLRPDHESSPKARHVKETLAIKEQSSHDDSMRSLSSLDDEAQLSGMELRLVREAEMNKEKGFIFSPLTHAATPDCVIKDESVTKEFSFTTPNVVGGKERLTRSMTKPTVTIEHRATPERDTVKQWAASSSFTVQHKATSDSFTIKHKVNPVTFAVWHPSIKQKSPTEKTHTIEHKPVKSQTMDTTIVIEPSFPAKEDTGKSSPTTEKETSDQQTISESSVTIKDGFTTSSDVEERTIKYQKRSSAVEETIEQIIVEPSISVTNKTAVEQVIESPLPSSELSSATQQTSAEDSSHKESTELTIANTSETVSSEASSEQVADNSTGPSERKSPTKEIVIEPSFADKQDMEKVMELSVTTQQADQPVSEEVSATCSSIIVTPRNTRSREKSPELMLTEVETVSTRKDGKGSDSGNALAGERPAMLSGFTDEVFTFSPVTHVATPDAVTSAEAEPKDFTFRTPNVVHTEMRMTRSMRKSKAASQQKDVAETAAVKASRARNPARKGSSNLREFTFSPLTQVASPGTPNIEVKVIKDFTFAPPSSAAPKEKGKSKSLTNIADAPSESKPPRTKGKRSSATKPIKPINIKLPQEHTDENTSNTKVLRRSRTSLVPQKPVKPVVIDIPKEVFGVKRSKEVEVPAMEETILAGSEIQTRSRARRDSESSVDSVQPSTGKRGRGRPRKNPPTTPDSKGALTKGSRAQSVPSKSLAPIEESVANANTATATTSTRTRLRSAGPKTGRIEVPKDILSDRISVSPTKKSQKATKDERRSTVKTRSSIKKPDLSPILSTTSESTRGGPQTRARRKL